MAVPAQLRGEPVALRVSQPLSDISALAARARGTGLALLGLPTVIALLVTARLASRTAEPVARLSRAARRMAAGDLETPVSAEPGELGQLAHALGDLAGQMRMRLDELEGEQNTLRTVLDGLEDAVFLFENETVRFANRAARTMFRPPAGAARQRELETSGLSASVAALVRSRLRVGTVPLGDTGGNPRTLVVVADVTERRRLDAMRRDLVANASHELKTSVSAIKLLAESAEAAAEDGDTAQAVAFAGQLAGEAEDLRLPRAR